MRKRRIEITVETHEVLALRNSRVPIVAWCTQCEGQSRMLTPDEAAMICGVPTRKVYRWVEAQEVHFKESPTGALHVCLHSLTLHPGADRGIVSARIIGIPLD